MEKITAYIVFEDGSAHIATYKLEGGLPFEKSEMEHWIKEQSEKPVKSVKFMDGKSSDLTSKKRGKRK